MELFPYIKKNIKVLINFRNPLDVVLSNTKHQQNDIQVHITKNNNQLKKTAKNKDYT